MSEREGQGQQSELEIQVNPKERSFSWTFFVLALICVALGFFKALFFGVAIVFVVLAFNWHKWNRRKKKRQTTKVQSWEPKYPQEHRDSEGPEERPLDRW